MDIYKCLKCGKELIKARNTKKFCNATCRKDYHRHISVAPQIKKIDPVEHISQLLAKDSVAEEELTYSNDY